jgi:hypothetical protein
VAKHLVASRVVLSSIELVSLVSYEGHKAERLRLALSKEPSRVGDCHPSPEDGPVIEVNSF